MAERNVSPLSVALADDEPDLRKVYIKLLERLGHRVVVVAANGAELLEKCFLQPVDVAIVDLDMPLVDGLTAAEELSSKGIPVVMISGHPDAAEVVLEHEPVAARIVKPATLATLQSALQKAVKLQS